MTSLMDGFETLQRLRQNPDTRDLPVVVITGERTRYSTSPL